MLIFPAIDLYEGKAVRLFKGDYNNMTVYSSDPLSVAKDFESCGAEYIHMVDLEGARDGGTPNFETVKSVCENTKLKVEIGGGVRSEEVIKRYLDAGALRVILGTAAITNPDFFFKMAEKYPGKIAAGADCRDGVIAIKGWLEKSEVSLDNFCTRLEENGVRALICTDISKDGAMKGTNRKMYKDLNSKFDLDIIASGGVSSLEDIKALRDMNMYGAIIGKAYYTKAINLREAIEVAK